MAINELRGKPEITRFKGLGEISPSEFKDFINENIKLEPVILNKETDIETLLEYYMGKNTPKRQLFIIDNLKVEKDIEKEEVTNVQEAVAQA
jgi:topoisomerase-4 subunit B